MTASNETIMQIQITGHLSAQDKDDLLHLLESAGRVEFEPETRDAGTILQGILLSIAAAGATAKSINEMITFIEKLAAYAKKRKDKNQITVSGPNKPELKPGEASHDEIRFWIEKLPTPRDE